MPLDKEFLSPIVFLRRAGTLQDPFIVKTETNKKIDQNGIIMLEEIPALDINSFVIRDENGDIIEAASFIIKRLGTTYTQIQEDLVELKPNEYRVDYTNGLIYFNPQYHRGGFIDSIQYVGRGAFYISTNRIYTGYDTIDEYVDTLDKTISEANQVIESADEYVLPNNRGQLFSDTNLSVLSSAANLKQWNYWAATNAFTLNVDTSDFSVIDYDNTSYTQGQTLTIERNSWLVYISGNKFQIMRFGKDVTKEDIGLDQVDNTSDMDKPVSTAQQAALDTKFDKTGGTIVGDVTLQGNLLIEGQALEVDTVTVEIEDNILLINKNQTGVPLSTLQSGIEVERGSLPNYFFIFNEQDSSFKIGEQGGLQSVATREDSPNDSGIAYWDNTAFQFKTDKSLAALGILADTNNSISQSNLSDGIVSSQKLDSALQQEHTDFNNHLSDFDNPHQINPQQIKALENVFTPFTQVTTFEFLADYLDTSLVDGRVIHGIFNVTVFGGGGISLSIDNGVTYKPVLYGDGNPLDFSKPVTGQYNKAVFNESLDAWIATLNEGSISAIQGANWKGATIHELKMQNDIQQIQIDDLIEAVANPGQLTSRDIRNETLISSSLGDGEIKYNFPIEKKPSNNTNIIDSDVNNDHILLSESPAGYGVVGIFNFKNKSTGNRQGIVRMRLYANNVLIDEFTMTMLKNEEKTGTKQYDFVPGSVPQTLTVTYEVENGTVEILEGDLNVSSRFLESIEISADSDKVVLVDATNETPAGDKTNQSDANKEFTTEIKNRVKETNLNTVITNEGNSHHMKIVTQFGYVTLGSEDTNSAYFKTDRGSYAFDKQLKVEGHIYLGYNKWYHSQGAEGSDLLRMNANSANNHWDFYNQTQSTWADIKIKDLIAVGGATFESGVTVNSDSGIKVKGSDVLASETFDIARNAGNDWYYTGNKKAGTWLRFKDSGNIEWTGGEFRLSAGPLENVNNYTRLNRSNASPVLYVNQYGTGDIARFYKGSGTGATDGAGQITFKNNGTISTNNNIVIGQGHFGFHVMHNSQQNRVLHHHNNGNVSVSAAGGDLYLGYDSGDDYQTNIIRLNSDLYTSDGTKKLIGSDGVYGGIQIGDGTTQNLLTLYNAPEASKSASRIQFKLNDNQNVQIRHNSHDSVRPPFGLHVERTDDNTQDSSLKAYLEVEGTLYAEEVAVKDSSNNKKFSMTYDEDTDSIVHNFF